MLLLVREVRQSEWIDRHETEHPDRSWNDGHDPWPAREGRHLSFRFKADSGRLLYALSIPEYIEIWLQAPEAEELRSVFNLVAQETFRLDLYRGDTLLSSVEGSCQVMVHNQLRYIWKTTSLVGATETLVDMKLLCGSEGRVLALKHSGFKDSIESAWCSRMWHQSLERLCRLMEKN